MNRPAGDGGGGGTVVQINISSFRQLLTGMDHASSDLGGAVAGAKSALERLWLSEDGFEKAHTILAWIDAETPGLKRRLAMAEQISGSTPGLPDSVTFNENALSTLTPTQAAALGRQAAKLVTSLDPGAVNQLNALLALNGDDPYFAHAFAQRATPRDLAAYIARLTPYERIIGGLPKEDYDALLTHLADTESLASRGTGDLAMPQSWIDDWMDKMTYPRFSGDPNDPQAYEQNKWDFANRGALWLLLSRGHWSTPFLQQVTTRFAALDAKGALPGFPPPASLYIAITPDGKRFTDPMVALMGALVNNPEAAHWAFTQGGSTKVPFPKDGDGVEGDVQTFLYNLLHEHRYEDDSTGPQTVMLALRAAMLWQRDQRIIDSANNLQKSMEQQKQVWDEKPWYSKWGHTILDVLGLIPFVGIPADAASTAWYGAEGDWVNSGLSAASLIPFAGDIAGAGKLFARGSKLAETLRLVDRLGKDLDLDSAVGRNLVKSIKVEDGVYSFTDMKALNAVLHSHAPNLEVRSQGLAFVTDEAGNVSELKVFVDGAWVPVDSSKLGLKLSQYKAGDTPWDLIGLTRGEVIETALAKTEYKGYEHVGKEQGGFYKGIDFYDQGEGVSLKTLDPPSATNAARIQKNIRDLEEMQRVGRTADGRRITSVEVDVRVRIGQENADALRELREYARLRGVTLSVNTY